MFENCGSRIEFSQLLCLKIDLNKSYAPSLKVYPNMQKYKIWIDHWPKYAN